MQILLIRHGKAEQREAFAASGQSDDLRPLTSPGQRDMQTIARGLHKLYPAIDLIATSPLKRALQTARILVDVYGGPEPLPVRELAGGQSLDAMLRWLKRQNPDRSIALVGHEPHLSTLAGCLLSGQERSLIVLKKGGACLLECDAKPAPGNCVLRWCLEPNQLRRL